MSRFILQFLKKKFRLSSIVFFFSFKWSWKSSNFFLCNKIASLKSLSGINSLKSLLAHFTMPLGSFHLNFSSSVTILNLTCYELSESLPSDEDESLEFEVSSRLLLLPYFFLFAGCISTSGESSLEELLSVEHSLPLRFFLLFDGGFDTRFSEDFLPFAEEFLSFFLRLS